MLGTGDQEQRSASEGTAPLKKRADFLQVQKGRKSVRNSLILQVRDRRDGSSLVRTGFTVSRKVGNAVERNRVRRRLREAMRETAPVAARSGHDYVIVGRRMALQTPYRSIVDDLASAFRSIHRAPASDR
ncbi:MAG: ribonuclease P protein component [Flavobacteriaceae bacterium]